MWVIAHVLGIARAYAALSNYHRPVSRVVLLLTFWLSAARTYAQPAPLDVGESSITLPLRVDLDGAFRHAEATVPTSELHWDRTDWTSSPFGTRYQIHRQALRFATQGDRVGVSAQLRYAVKVYARAGAFGYMLDTEIGSCGAPGREPFREAVIGLDLRVSLGQDFRIVTRTTPRAPWYPNPCELTLFRYNATPLIRRTTRFVLEHVASTIDERVAREGDLRPHVLRAWAALHRAIPLTGGAVLLVRPVSIAAVSLRFEGRVAVTEIEIRIRTAIAPAGSPAPAVAPLPRLAHTTPRRGARLAVDSSVGFAELAVMAEHALVNETFPMGRFGAIRVTRVGLAAEDGRVRVNLGLRGAPVSAISLVGTPTWDPETNVLSLADLDYVVHGGGMLVELVEEARHGVMRAQLRTMLRWDVSRQGSDLRARLLTALVNTELGGGVRMTGELGAPRVTALHVRDDGIDVAFVIDGDLLLHVAATPR